MPCEPAEPAYRPARWQRQSLRHFLPLPVTAHGDKPAGGIPPAVPPLPEHFRRRELRHTPCLIKDGRLATLRKVSLSVLFALVVGKDSAGAVRDEG